VDVAQQLLAVGNAITNAKRTLVHEHINCCLEVAGPSKIRELQAISKYL
jgi:DNA-binding FrmR family transcriptional regulator